MRQFQIIIGADKLRKLKKVVTVGLEFTVKPTDEHKCRGVKSVDKIHSRFNVSCLFDLKKPLKHKKFSPA